MNAADGPGHAARGAISRIGTAVPLHPCPRGLWTEAPPLLSKTVHPLIPATFPVGVRPSKVTEEGQ